MRHKFLRPAVSAALAVVVLTSLTQPSAQTLFANPRCDNWASMEKSDKLVLLNAVIAPLNMAYVTRVKPAVDKFVKLNSVEPALAYVNDYCAANPTMQANAGMLDYHAQLVK